MELRDIRYFVVVAEHKNIGRAAEALGLSATALSKSLRRLEKSVGAKLILGSPKGVALTTVGAALLTRIRPLQGMLSDVRHEAAELAQGATGHIDVGASSGDAESFLADACVVLSREAPQVTYKASVLLHLGLDDALLKGTMDFCVADAKAFPAVDYVHEKLYVDPFVVYAASNHRLARRKNVAIADLAQERWASTSPFLALQWQQLILAFAGHGLPPPKLALQTNSQVIRNSAIAHSDYLGVSSRRFFMRESQTRRLIEIPVKELTNERHMAVIYRKGAYISPVARRMIDVLKRLIMPKSRARG